MNGLVKNGNGHLSSDGEMDKSESNASFLEEGGFLSGGGERFGLEELVGELAVFMASDETCFYRLVIGSDSQAKRVEREMVVDFVTVVVIHRVGKGGRYFWQRKREARKYVLRDRIYTETVLSLELAQVLVPRLKKVLNGEKYELEIHIDVGEAGPTREMIAEVVGMVTGNGFTAKIKPEGYGAFVVADKHT